MDPDEFADDRYGSRKKVLKSNFILHLLTAGIFVLSAFLIIQIVIIVRSKENQKEFSYTDPKIIDGKYVDVATSCGFVQGLVENKSFAFLGIPFAIPPTGARRFRNSEVPNRLEHCWKGTFSAKERRKPCWQFFRNGSYDGAEDCLFLNIYTNKLHTDSPLPVVVFLGGDNLDGGESLEIQPSAKLAATRNVVFVSPSIRRSSLGFLSLKFLSEKRNSPRGNYGISDLLTALMWIKYNIRNFGGDSNDVTILGQNSGATIISALLKNSKFKTDLFHKVWLSGGNCHDPIMPEEANIRNKKLLELIECDNPSCLFSRTPEEILEGVPFEWRTFHHDLSISSEDYHQWLIYDGRLLPTPENVQNEDFQDENDIFSRLESFKPARAWDIPVVAGAPLHCDASAEMRQSMDWNSTERYQKYLISKLGIEFAKDGFQQYYRPDLNHWQQFVSMLSDSRTICPLLDTSFNKFPSSRTIFYITTHKSKFPWGFLAAGNTDILAIFDLDNPHSYRDRKFSDNMASLFYTFVRTGFIIDKMQDTHSRDEQLRKIFIVDDRVVEVGEYDNCELWMKWGKSRDKYQVENLTNEMGNDL